MQRLWRHLRGHDETTNSHPSVWTWCTEEFVRSTQQQHHRRCRTNHCPTTNTIIEEHNDQGEGTTTTTTTARPSRTSIFSNPQSDSIIGYSGDQHERRSTEFPYDDRTKERHQHLLVHCRTRRNNRSSHGLEKFSNRLAWQQRLPPSDQRVVDH